MSDEKFDQSLIVDIDLIHKVITEQFPEYAHFSIRSVEKQGHDNRTYRLGDQLLVRLPTAKAYALKVPKEQDLLPKIAPFITVKIPSPVKMGVPSLYFPYPFSIYTWLDGTSINLLNIDDNAVLEQLAFDLANFLKELRAITGVEYLAPGQHNWWRGDHQAVYDDDSKKQIVALCGVIDTVKAMSLWNRALETKWHQHPVWIHGDLAVGNILLKENKLYAVIDFGGLACGDPACDLVIAWTFFKGKARDIFIKAMNMDEKTWLRARAWALWKATFILCAVEDNNTLEACVQKTIIRDVLSE